MTKNCYHVRECLSGLWMKSLTFVAGLLLAYTTQAQTITVTDAETGKGVELVTVISQNPRGFVITDENGQADVSEFRGSLRMEIRALGYVTVALAFHELEMREFKVSLKRDHLQIDEVVVSATRWRQSADDISTRVKPIRAKDVQLHNPQNAADLLELSGKVFVQKSQQGGGSPMIRGFSANRLLYTVDGVRMNSAIFRSGNLQNVINIDPFATESAEVLFGPGSVIYGSDAIGGVMSFQTLRPKFSNSNDDLLVTGKADLRFASANQENTGHFDINVGWEKWAIVTSISSWKFDHLRQGRHGPIDFVKPYYVQRVNNSDVWVQQEDQLLQIPTGYSQINFMQKVRHAPNERWDIEFGFHYSETSEYGRYDRHNRMRDGLPRHARWDYGPQIWMMNNLVVNHVAERGAFDEVTLRLAHQRFEESRIDRNFLSTRERTSAETVDALSMNLDFKKEANERMTIFYGFESIYNDVRSSGSARDILTGERSQEASRYPDADWYSLAAYLSAEYRLNEKTTWNAGVRYNQFGLNAVFNTEIIPLPFTDANLDNGAVTGSTGVVYRPDDSWAFSGTVSTAFRAPNVDDIGKVFDSEPGAVVVPNPDLTAEYAYNAEVSVAKVFAEILKIDVTAFYTILDNAMVRRDFELAGQDTILFAETPSRVQAIQNAASANVYGLQFGLDLRLGHGFSVSSDLNWQVGREEMDDGVVSPSRHAAPLFGVSRLNFNRQNLTLQFYAMYQGGFNHEELAIEERSKREIYALDENGNTFAPAWHTLNFKAMYAISDQFTLSGGLENITDQRYRTYSSGISGAGRNFILSGRVTF